jgi:LAS superfamily LD-carboxypeptidase LdcB
VILNARQLTGRAEDHLQFVDGVGLQAACWHALESLQNRAARAGFKLEVASGFRSFERQLAIWNEKARGERPVHDDQDARVDMDQLDDLGKLEAILRYSALPGGSRHHWGTDLDVFDAAAIPEGYRLQLSPMEVAEDGIMGSFHQWLDGELAEGAAFFRPYAADRGGVAVERWHLSFEPLARDCEAGLTVEVLREALASCELELADAVLDRLPALFARYVRRRGD